MRVRIGLARRRKLLVVLGHKSSFIQRQKLSLCRLGWLPGAHVSRSSRAGASQRGNRCLLLHQLSLLSHAPLLLKLSIFLSLCDFFSLVITVEVTLKLVHQAFLHILVQLVGLAEVGSQNLEIISFFYSYSARSGGCDGDLDA